MKRSDAKEVYRGFNCVEGGAEMEQVIKGAEKPCLRYWEAFKLLQPVSITKMYGRVSCLVYELDYPYHQIYEIRGK